MEASIRHRYMFHWYLALDLVVFTVLCGIGDANSVNKFEYASFDGWYNNFAHPDWGASETSLVRLIPSEYADGVYTPSGGDRPNPLEISQIAFDGPTGLASNRNKTALLVFFGEHIVDEILDTRTPGCPPEYFNIPIPTCHPLYDPNCKGGREMPFLRSEYDQRTGLSPNAPRAQINAVSSYLDGTAIYGPNKAWANALRSYKDGLLAALNDTNSSAYYFPAQNLQKLPFDNPPPPRDHVLKPVTRFYVTGNQHGNENPFLLTMGILWFRFHNLKARQLKVGHPDWSDEKLFQESRKWTIATYQKIVYYDWLAAWLNQGLDKYTGKKEEKIAERTSITLLLGNPGLASLHEVSLAAYRTLGLLVTYDIMLRCSMRYNPKTDPQISHVFQSAAFRFGHTLVPPGVFRRNAQCSFRNSSSGDLGLRICNSYWNSPDIVSETDIDELLMGMSSQLAEREDNIVTSDLHGFVFGGLEFSRRDLMAINIQRGRDHGLTDYNTARAAFGLPKLNNFSDFENINPKTSYNLHKLKPEIFSNLSALYGNDGINKLDVWVGGMLETSELGPGPLFTAIILEQFARIRDGDRFWFENVANGLFTAEELSEIHNTTLKDVITAVTNISMNDIQDNPFFHNEGDPCPQPFQLSDAVGVEPCTDLQVFDYFTGSATPYIITLLFIFGSVLPIILVARLCVYQHKRVLKAGATKSSAVHLSAANRNPDLAQSTRPATVTVTVTEWIGCKKGKRSVGMIMDVGKKQLRIVKLSKNTLLRSINISSINAAETIAVVMSNDSGMSYMIVRVPKEYDLVLRFYRQYERQEVLDKLQLFIAECGLLLSSPSFLSVRALKAEAITRDVRQKRLELFFTAILSHALHMHEGQSSFEPHSSPEILTYQLTKHEFAEAFGMRAESVFIDNLYRMVDKRNNGYICFREFLEFFVLFSTGSSNEKARLLFDMYDLQHSGRLSTSNFKLMLKSMIELANEKARIENIDKLVDMLFNNANLNNDADITFDDFNVIFQDHQHELKNGFKLPLTWDKKPDVSSSSTKKTTPTRAKKCSKRSYNLNVPIDNIRESVTVISASWSAAIEPLQRKPPKSVFQKWSSFSHVVELYRRQIFWITLYLLVTFGIFIERVYYYSFEREETGVRRILGCGISITKGAASAMMFTYVSLLVVMCRNIIVYLRGTWLNTYVPFDNAVDMHKFIAVLAAIFTAAHIVGHCINFYSIATQSPNDVMCLFRNIYYSSDYLPKYTDLAWKSITGVSGILLTIQVILICTFSSQYARKNAYRAFWLIHRSYPIFFILIILHGSARLVQGPYFYYFFLGPVILFTIDQLISVSRRRIEVEVVRAEILPSDVTTLVFCKPPNFHYHAGQWIRIACLGRNKREFHPFTLTSSPNEEHLSVHMQAVGPWTRHIRKLYNPQNPNNVLQTTLPKVIVDGPYGEGHQDWNKYEVSILIGAGIGVTPFASILKQIAYISRTSTKNHLCKKVYFMWVTRTQHQYEWLIDIIREVEQGDTENFVSVHVFITQFKEKFDFRTTMLFICEEHFQKLSERSLFTGLKSKTHFGRPDFRQLFKLVMEEHPLTDVFGVFSCGPPPLLQSVQQACSMGNRMTRNVLFVHHAENF